jgi:hypothetical protein
MSMVYPIAITFLACLTADYLNGSHINTLAKVVLVVSGVLCAYLTRAV